MTVLKQISQRILSDLEGKHLRRHITTNERQEGIYIIRDGKKLISFCSNDYFGLSQHPKVIEASVRATHKYGAGAGASRLITGNHPLYDQLEQNIAKFKTVESACVFGSGYLANVGTIPAIVGKGDIVIADKLAHACILDGIKLSDAKFLRYKHNDLKHLKRILESNRNSYSNCLIITETIFSMDGDMAPVDKIVTLAKQYDCWTMTDDAHGLGFSKANNTIDVQMGTLSKGAGSYGGYVAGNAKIIDLIKNQARSLIYSTALPPGVIAAANAGIEIIIEDSKLIVKPVRLAEEFCRQLSMGRPQSLVVPLVVGNEEIALDASRKLEEKGFLVSAIRPPTVPQNTARLRLTFSSLHKIEQVQALVKAIKELNLII